MFDPETLVARYLAPWNEADPARRRALVEAAWRADGRYVDPLAEVAGHEGLDGLIGAVQAQFAGLRFRPAGTPDAHHDRLRFRWELAGPDGAAVASGTDVATLDGDGRFVAVTGFIDSMPA
jgi:hypothetical protein